jgi:hypothetical protein
MPYYKFGKNDKIVNYAKSYPSFKFSIKGARVYLNLETAYHGSFSTKVKEIDSGFISLYEMNIDRDFSKHTYDSDSDAGVKAKIFPFITKDSNLGSFSTISTTNYNQFQYGDILTGSYPLSSSIVREGFAANHGTTASTGSHVLALKNVLNHYKTLSNHYAFSSSLGDKSTQRCNLISIPSIFFGQKIKKGSVKLNYYISGSKIGTLEDVYEDGTLVQTSGSTYAQTQGSDSVAGVVLYNEGFLLLTGSWQLGVQNFDLGTATEKPMWVNFAVGCNDGLADDDLTPSASFEVEFKGTTITPTLTMFAHARKGELNYSSNPTFVDKATRDGKNFSFSTSSFSQPNYHVVKNVVSSSFSHHSASFEKQTFISKVGIYDSNKNLIAIAHMARPVRKKENDDYTFKLKLDI